MESANLQLPGDQLVGSPPNLAAPSCFGFGSNLAATWSSSSTPPTTFTNDGIVSINSSTRQKISIDHHHNSILVSDVHINPLSNASTSCDNLVDQDLGFSSNQTAANYNDQLARIKEELSEISFPKFTELLNSPSNSDIDVYGNFPFKADNLRCLSCCSSGRNSTGTDHNPSPLMVKSLSSSCPINGPLFDHSDGTGTAISSSGFGGGLLALQGCRGKFSQVNPTVNISNLSQYSLMGMNGKPGFDHLASSARFYNMVGTVNGQPNLGTFGVDPIQQLHSKTISSFNGEITETKRPSSLMEPKTSSHIKKSRLESRTSSCPPFKVRKEKLGDRIAALQQLVSPFGKTDTASVLMEAIGYIKFLQSQVETLSVPYMKSSRNKSSKTMQGGQKDQDGNGEEPKRDLKSRGLCLVPLSCMSYVTGDGGAGSIWPPVPNFDSAGRIT